jgi:hypothetical protein
VLRTDPFHLAWRRARALEQVAGELGSDGAPAPLGDVRMALEALPASAWGLPGMGPPALPPPGGGSGAAPGAAPGAAGWADTDETDALPETSRALVPAGAAEMGELSPVGRIARLDAFASDSPTLRLAFRQLGRAVAAKAVRLVVWRRRAA